MGLFVEVAGLYFIGRDIKVNTVSSIPFEAFVLTLIAAAFWGISNIIIRYASKQAVLDGNKLDMLSMVVWSSIVPPGPFLVIALLENTPEILWYSVLNLNIWSWSSIFYLAFGATLFGYGIWSALLAKYSTGKIAPISLLIPIIGLITAKIILCENISMMQWVGGGVIILGLIISNINYLPIQSILKQYEK